LPALQKALAGYTFLRIKQGKEGYYGGFKRQLFYLRQDCRQNGNQKSHSKRPQ